MTKQIAPRMHKVMLLSFALVLISACTPQTKDSTTQPMAEGCINLAEAAERKAQLEGGIRGKVKFMGEAESLSSITNSMAAYGIPALSLAVINQGKIEWAEAYQGASADAAQNLGCSSMFQAASLSKPVTFLAAVRMHAAGEIELDRNIQDYLKEFVLPQGKQTAENPVTFRNIFAHTSGISPGGYQGYARDLAVPTDLAILQGGEGVNTPAIAVINPPNEVLAYSGGGYTLAELALQDIYNDAFSNIMKKWILEPAGMNHSEFTQPLPAADANRIAKGHTFSGDVVAGGWRNHPEQAAAGLWSNATDLAKFLIEIHKAYHGESSIFSPADIQAILSHQRNGQVYGFIVHQSEDDIAITHYGGNEGYRTGMTISLTHGQGLVYLTNSDNGGALGNELLLSASQVYNWQHFKQTEVQRKPVDVALLQRLAGDYKWNSQIDLSVTFDENKGRISLHFPNGDEYVLAPIAGEEDELAFIHPSSGVRVGFPIKDNYQAFTLYGQTAVKQ